MASDPTNKNFLGQTGFRLVLERTPTMNYFSQSASLPAISLGAANIVNPLIDYPLPGEKLTFSPFNISFRVDEDLKNYIEIYDWLVGLGSPSSTELLFTSTGSDIEYLEATVSFRYSLYTIEAL